MAASQISTSVTIINSLLGFQAISLSNMTTSAATVITDGSKVEIASAFFNFTTDSTPQASTWTAITTGNTAYITLTPSGTAGSQILTAMWSETAPVWSDTKQGWYSSAGSIIRYVGGCYKNGATSYQDKFIALNTADTRQIRILGGSNADRQIVFASDAALKWDESADYFVYNKWAQTYVNTYTSASATQNAIFDALSPFIPTTAQSIIVSGGGSVAAQPAFFGASYANRVSATVIRIYGAEKGAANGESPPTYWDCTDGSGTEPTSNSSSLVYDYVSISW